MAKVLQHRRGTTAEHENFVGAEGEITVDTEKHSIRVHDGVTAGGHALVTDADLATVRATAEGSLPKSGGTLTGEILQTGDFPTISQSVDDEKVLFNGGSSYGNGASLSLSGKSRSGYAGQFNITASDGTNTKVFTGTPDGKLTWGGKDVITSAGGTMTGILKFSSADTIERTVDNSYTAIRGGSAYANGASLVLYGKSETDGARFRLIAHDGTNKPELIGKSNGALTWVGKNIVCSVNGTTADANGNVTISSDGWKEVSSATVTITNTSDNTVTLSGLTSDRPVILKFYAQNGSYGYPRKCYARIKSGLIAGPITGADGSSGSNSTTDFPYVVNAQVAKNTNPTFISSYPLLATGTSCSLILQTSNAASNAKYNITITAYQW